MITEIENNSMAPKEEIDVIRRAFESSDLNKDGYLSRAELKAFIQKMGKIKKTFINPLVKNGYLQEMSLTSTSPSCSTRLTSTRTGRLILRSLFKS